MAESLGHALGGTPEYRTLERAAQVANNDRELVRLTEQVNQLKDSLAATMQEGKEPPAEELQKYEDTLGKLQASSIYQSLIAAQTNFDKVMAKVDTAMQKGLRKGVESRIIIAP